MDGSKAFEELVRSHQGVVCAVAYAILRDRARSEEIAQEAFLIAWQKLPAMDPMPKLPAWVCGIARNLAANAARRKKETSMETTEHEPAATTPNPAELILDRERYQLAHQALAALGEHDREAIVVYYRGEGSYTDVAATLGITETAARQRVHRGRERLKTALGAVETTLRATRPSHAFTAACVAALAAGGASNASAATTTVKKSWIALPIAALVVGGGVVVVASSSGSSSSSTSTIASTTVGDARAAAPDSAYFKKIDTTARMKLIDKIRDAQHARAKSAPLTTRDDQHVGSGGDSSETAGTIRHGVVKTYDFSGDVLAPAKNGPAPDPTKLGKATMRYAIRDVTPLLLECYGDAFDRLPRKDGTLEVRLVLVGEPGLATVVESVEVGGDPHLTKDAAFVECMRETLYTVEMPPMPQPETWNVNYPFTLAGTRP